MRQGLGANFLIIGAVIFFGYILAGGYSAPNFVSTPPDSTNPVNVIDTQTSKSDNSLQLRTLGVTTPTPAQNCGIDNGQPVNNGQLFDPNSSCKCPYYVIECKDKKCVKVDQDSGPEGTMPSCNPTYDGWCANPSLAPIDGIFCLAKPVIYLYPKIDTLVSVKLDTPGKITDSIPLYPDNGWKNILAHPNGTFEYNGTSYNELYYESSVNKVTAPKEGMVIKTENLKKTLIDLTGKLGLISNEQNELVNYWLPRVNALNSPYILVSVVDNSEKQKIDEVEISPKPDTMIEFLLYFKPEPAPLSVKQLSLPKTPQRVGFTAVEWGGTIGTN